MTGLYFCDADAVQIARGLPAFQPRRAGDHRRQPRLPRARPTTCSCSVADFAWLDTGTHENLLDAGQFVQTIQRRQAMKIACLEEIALERGWLSRRRRRCRRDG